MGLVPIYSQGFALLCLFKRLLRRFAPRNARSAFLTVFSPYSLRQTREEKKGPVPIFSPMARLQWHFLLTCKGQTLKI